MGGSAERDKMIDLYNEAKPLVEDLSRRYLECFSRLIAGGINPDALTVEVEGGRMRLKEVINTAFDYGMVSGIAGTLSLALGWESMVPKTVADIKARFSEGTQPEEGRSKAVLAGEPPTSKG